MKIVKVSAICSVVLLIGGRVPLAAPGQEYTSRPGDPTQAKVWIQNTPLGVEIQNTPSVTMSASTVIQTKLVRQAWEYQTMTVAVLGVARELSRRGEEGWEATGLQFQGPNGIEVVFKRPR